MSKQGGSAKARKDQRRSKATRKGCVGEPDVIVVVGKQEFHEHSKHLCCWSEYFDAALKRSGMRESITKRFEFLDQDPEEWELIMAMLSPFCKTEITKDNVKAVVTWSSRLLIPALLDKCDKFLHDVVLCKIRKDLHFGRWNDRDLHKVLEEYLPLTAEANLTASKVEAMNIAIIALEELPFLFKPHHLTTMVEIVKDDDMLWSKLRGHLEHHLPELFPIIDSSTNKEVGEEGDEAVCALLLLAVSGVRMTQREENLVKRQRQLIEKESSLEMMKQHKKNQKQQDLESFEIKAGEAFFVGMAVGAIGFCAFLVALVGGSQKK